MKAKRRLFASLLCVSLIQASCWDNSGPKIDNKVPLTKVVGEVALDSVPAEDLIVSYTPLGEIAEKRWEYVNYFQVHTSNEGKFALTTYVAGDAIPLGEYAITFSLTGRGNKNKTLPDQYTNPKNATLKISVKDEEIDLGVIELTSKTRELK